MFHRLVTLFALFLLGLPAAAKCTGQNYLDQLRADERAALAAATADIPFGRGILWGATNEDQQITVVGTMHIYDERLEPIRARIKDLVQNADLLMVEATIEDQENLQKMLAADPGILFITEGPTLPDLLDEETWNLISEAATARSIPSFMAAKMQPWYLSIMLSIPPCAAQEMFSGFLGLDHLIMQDAEAAGVPMQSVESTLTIFEIFKGDPIDEQIDMLRINLLAPDVQQQMFVAMLDRYFDGDVATLWEMSRVVMENTPGMSAEEAAESFATFEKSLLVDRNQAWMPVIREASSQHDNIVIAVGAAHLIGNEGILQFLQDDGWTLSPLR